MLMIVTSFSLHEEAQINDVGPLPRIDFGEIPVIALDHLQCVDLKSAVTSTCPTLTRT